MGTWLPEIALSAWMSASSFAVYPRCMFTLTRNVANLALVLFRSSLIAYNKMSVSGALNFTFPPSPTHLCYNFQERLVVTQTKHGGFHSAPGPGCHVMPRQRQLFPDSLSWIIPLRVPPSFTVFSLYFAGSLNLLPFPPLFG